MATVDGVQKSVDDLGKVVGSLQKQFQDFREFLMKYLAENMATKQDLNDLRDEMATKEELRGYAALVENAVAKSVKSEEEELAHRQEHDDLLKRVKTIESVPVVAHSLRKN